MNNTEMDIHAAWIDPNRVDEVARLLLLDYAAIRKANPNLTFDGKKGTALRLPTREKKEEAANGRSYGTIPLCLARHLARDLSLRNVEDHHLAYYGLQTQINEQMGPDAVGLTLRGRPLFGHAYVMAKVNTVTRQLVQVQVFSDSSPSVIGRDTAMLSLVEVQGMTNIFSHNGYAEAYDAAVRVLASQHFEWTRPLWDERLTRDVDDSKKQ